MISPLLLSTIVVVIICLISQYYTEKIGESYYSKHTNNTLWDVSYQVLPNLCKYEFIIDILLVLSFIPLLVNFQYSGEFLKLILILFLIRAVLVVVTVMPGHDECEKSNFSFLPGHCFDKIFSGHTACFFLLTLIYHKYKIINIQQLVIANIIFSILIVATRSHYTVDVLLSYIITILLFNSKFKF